MTTAEVVRSKAKRMGVKSVARQLRTQRLTLTTWLAGLAREGTALMLEKRAAEVFGAELPEQGGQL